jgi:hypothetical protein
VHSAREGSADYVFDMLANAHSRFYLREFETDDCCQPRPDCVLAMIML